MAYDIAHFNGGTVAPSTDYPFGDVKDDPSGTRVDRKSMDDIFQYFQKVMGLAAISPNNTPDNFGNGYQFVDALQTVTSPSFDPTGCVFQTIGGNTWANLGAPCFDFAPKLNNGIVANEVSLRGVVTVSAMVAGTPPIVQLPSAYFPAMEVRKTVIVKYGSTLTPTIMTISTGGLISIDSAVTSAGTVYFDGLSYPI